MIISLVFGTSLTVPYCFVIFDIVQEYENNTEPVFHNLSINTKQIYILRIHQQFFYRVIGQTWSRGTYLLGSGDQAQKHVHGIYCSRFTKPIREQNLKAPWL